MEERLKKIMTQIIDVPKESINNDSSPDTTDNGIL